MSKNQSQHSPRRSFLTATVAIVILALGTGIYQRFLAGPPDFPGPGEGTTSITVESGESLAEIGNALKRAGVVQSVDAFISASETNPQSTSIQPGRYQLRLKMASRDALSMLISGDSRTRTGIIISEGLRASEIFKRISAHSSISLAALQEATKHPKELGLPAQAKGNLEGYLYPATYEVDSRSTASSILKEMISKAKTIHSELDLNSAPLRNGHTEREILTIASILEAEAHPRDYAKVARVIYNRIALPMRLQMDSTVAYGLGIKRVMLSQTQLDTDTPFNTYIHDGLPPAPIGNPGRAAIEAALHPATGDWLYFLTVNLDTQETKFTISYNEFLTYKSQFLSYCSSHVGKC